MDEPQYEIHLFNPIKPLFPPSVIAPLKYGKISVNLQFAIPDLHIAKKEKDDFYKLIKNCLDSVFGSRIIELKKERYTCFEIAFYIDYMGDEGKHRQIMDNKSRILIERLLGVISFCAKKKVRAINVVPTLTSSSSYTMVLHAQSKSHTQDKNGTSKIKFSIPKRLYEEKAPSSEVFTALFWLRRGLADGDPIDTYNAFMVCLQILARDWFNKRYPQSKNISITKQFESYMTTEIGADPHMVEKVWKKRNAIAAHGNKLDIDADDFIGLTELKFEAAIWAYQGINRALGLASDSAPKLNQDFFVTDALINLD